VALKVFAIVIVLFLAEIIFLSTKDFDNNQNERKDIDFTDIAFENIEAYLLTKDEVVAKLEAKSVLKYREKSEIFDIKTEFLHKNLKNSITSDKAILKGDVIELSGDVHYENNNSMKIDTQNLIYNTKTEIIKTTYPFILTSLRGDVEGNGFIYDQKNGNIKANKIRYKSFEIKREL